MRTAKRLLGEMFFGPKDEAADAGAGVRITGDKPSLGALQDALHAASATPEMRENPALAKWCDQAWKAVAKGLHSGTVTLPSYDENPPAKPDEPDLDSFDDDQGPGPDDDEEY